MTPTNHSIRRAMHVAVALVPSVRGGSRNARH
jgi:hypothetical protein